ncbi:hypothetical protein V2J09_003423 [Rumex salicifolius]
MVMITKNNFYALLPWLLLLLISFLFIMNLNEARELALPAMEKITPMSFPKSFEMPKPSYKDIDHDHDHREVYIVYMGSGIKGDISPDSLYRQMLSHVTAAGRNVRGSEECLLHTYKNSFHGFAVKLTSLEAKAMAELEGVVSVFRSRKHRLHTTRSWDFMGVPLGVSRSKNEGDVIVGVIDTGVWPESLSFNDNGFGPIPSKWKGFCDPSFNFTCNRKLIGARYSRIGKELPSADVASPRDTEGHGTHTASTAAGSAVKSASYVGLGTGTARGGVPSARVAVYKVCWSDGCFDEDILAAFDLALRDGVDVLSVSIGFDKARPYFQDSIAIGSFHAMKKGVFTSVSAGNSGPGLGTVENTAPWFLSVAASTIDRELLTGVQLSNSMKLQGPSINPDNLLNQKLIYGGDAQNSSSTADSRVCEAGSLDPSLVRGKIVLCLSISEGVGPYMAGASGVIMSDDGPKDIAYDFPLPTAYLDLANNTSPIVASFSSRGPSKISPGILKPDLSAPGVGILAAWSDHNPPIPGDKRKISFAFDSGTSMACPHATGVAAYVKSFHPTWSTAAIQSALMTTCKFILSYPLLSLLYIALPMDPSKNVGYALAYGAGHLNPLQAVDPGLVYDASEADYIRFLCSLGYSTAQVQLISDDTSTCLTDSTTVFDLNYPSMMAYIDKSPYTNTFTRVITNVGSPNATYKVAVPKSSQYLSMRVDPNVLQFTASNQKKSFTVTVSGSMPNQSYLSSYLVWDDGKHKVRIIPMDLDRNPNAAFAYGAGHLNPLQAVDSGLVYNASEADYVGFLCSLGYNTTQVRLISDDKSTCSTDQTPAFDLNYPSMMVYTDKSPYTNTFTRTVMNDETLQFTELNQKKSFTVTVSGSMPDNSSLRGLNLG